KEMAHQTKQAPEFIKSRLVTKSAEYLLWYKQALKMMQQGKDKLSILSKVFLLCKKSDTEYSSTMSFRRWNSELENTCGKHTYCYQ
uniref:Uncharacterized protein n=1 Tax=Melopsittacus undulatus TaxID=13146 RepID=A0A8V5GM90_MELUD